MADEYAIARELIAARAGMPQGEVAQCMGTTQSVVARLESGKRPHPCAQSGKSYTALTWRKSARKKKTCIAASLIDTGAA